MLIIKNVELVVVSQIRPTLRSKLTELTSFYHEHYDIKHVLMNDMMNGA